MGLGIDPKGRGASQRVWEEERAGIVLASIYAIGVGRQRRDAAPSVEGESKAQQKLGVAPAAPFAAHGHRCLAARYQRARNFGWLTVPCDLLCNRRVNERHITRLALDGIA